MRLAFAILLVGHGLLHLLGFAKAFQFAELSQLARPISPFMGVLWFAAAMLFPASRGEGAVARSCRRACVYRP